MRLRFLLVWVVPALALSSATLLTSSIPTIASPRKASREANRLARGSGWGSGPGGGSRSAGCSSSEGVPERPRLARD